MEQLSGPGIQSSQHICLTGKHFSSAQLVTAVKCRSPGSAPVLEQHVLHTGHRADCPSVRARRDPALPRSAAACAAGTLLHSPPDFEGQRHRVLFYHSALAVRVGGRVGRESGVGGSCERDLLGWSKGAAGNEEGFRLVGMFVGRLNPKLHFWV